MEVSGGKSGPLALKFHQQPPEFPFQHVYFDVKIFLQELETGEPRCGAGVPLQLRLWYDETPRVPAPLDCVEVEGGQRELYIRKETGCCEIRVRVTKCSMDLENRSFSLCATADDAEQILGSAVLEAYSTPLKVMRHRLVIDDGPWEDPWYKDEGGRDKCIELFVRLVDSDGGLVTNRRVPLKVSLLYDKDLIAVTNQDILKQFGPSGEGSDMLVESGVSEVKVRIEDVSKNHQGQNFRIKVAPDTMKSPTDCDVAHDLSRAVTVRSKRNKRRGPAPNPASGTAVAVLPQARDPVGRPSPVIDGPPGPISTIPGQISRSMRSADDLKLVSDSDTCRIALDAAVDWMRLAMDGMRQMEWRLAGYEPLADGTADSSRPLYVMSNPNDRIHGLLKAYEDNVAPLSQAVLADEAPAMMVPQKRQRRSRNDDDELSPLERPKLSRARTSVNAVLEAIGSKSSGPFQASMFDDEASNKKLPPPVSAPPPPSMLRGVSSLYVGENIGASPGGGGNSLANSLANSLGPSLGSTPEESPADLKEQAVRVVLAKRFKPPRAGAAALGFPAFDGDKRLVGLYREIQAGNSTQIVFVPADDPDAGLQQGDSELATKAYERELANKSDCVHDLAKHGTLERLKENVAIYHWSKEAFANDIDSSDLAKSAKSTNGVKRSANGERDTAGRQGTKDLGAIGRKTSAMPAKLSA